MKILITENKRYQLAYNILDDVLEGLTREDYDANHFADSVFSNHQVLFQDSDLNLKLRYSEKEDRLTVYKDFWEPLRVLSFGDDEIERVIMWWFQDRVNLHVDSVYLVGYRH
jgi:hypothetical protein